MALSNKHRYFNNKHCIITGASSGIGKLLAVTLASYGAKLVLLARNTERLTEVEQECKTQSSHHDIYSCTVDLGKMEDAQRAYQYAQQKLGTIDILVANAGASMHSLISDTEEQIYHTMMNANFYSGVNIILSALPFLKRNQGKIVAITSIQSIIGVPYHGAYVASKHAFSGFLETLELEEPNVQIVELLSGWVSGTNIRENALDGKGNPARERHTHKQRHSRSTLSVEEVVESIIYGILKNKRQLYRPRFWKNIFLLKYAMRPYLQKIISRRQHISSQ